LPPPLSPLLPFLSPPTDPDLSLSLYYYYYCYYYYYYYYCCYYCCYCLLALVLLDLSRAGLGGRRAVAWTGLVPVTGLGVGWPADN